jgi:hypothetical protein
MQNSIGVKLFLATIVFYLVKNHYIESLKSAVDFLEINIQSTYCFLSLYTAEAEW